MRLIIEKNDQGELSFVADEQLSAEELFLILFSTMKGVALNIIRMGTTSAKAKGKKAKENIEKAIRGDLADMINYGASNVIRDICPDDAHMDLTEVAIATMENQIIKYATDKKIPIEQAIKEYQEVLLEDTSLPERVLNASTERLS